MSTLNLYNFKYFHSMPSENNRKYIFYIFRAYTISYIMLYIIFSGVIEKDN